MEDYNDLNHANHDKLPPRSVYHAQAKGNDKNNFKIKLPFIRLFMFIAAILVVTIVSISLFSKDSSPTGGTAQPDEPTPPISNIGQADSDEEEDKDTGEEEDSSNVVVVKPNITIKPVTPTDQTDGSADSQDNTKEDTELEVETPQTNSPTTTPSTTPATPETPKVEYIQHVVQKEETLYRIAMNYLKSPDGVETIKKLNGLKDTTIKEGQILKIPKQ